MLGDVLLFPAGTDLHDHPLVEDSRLILQVGKLLGCLLTTFAVNNAVTMCCCFQLAQICMITP